MTDVAARSGEVLSARLKAVTWGEHDRTNSAPFIVALMDGRLDRDAYVALLAQTYLFYRELERAGAAWRDHPVVGPFVSDALVRGGALEADLTWLCGDGWRARLAPLPATRRYVDRIREVCFDSPSAFVAHHYTRYLGDLSGGQIVRRKLRAGYGLTTDGVRFYVFDQIQKPKVFKDEYRRLLDDLTWDEPERRSLVAEVNLAFRLNRAVFDDLGDALGVDQAGR